jgi:uncharacterized protein (DUF302 family)
MGAHGEDVVIKSSPWSVADTVTRRLAVAAARELKVFAVIDHSAEADSIGLRLRDTKLVIFGSPSSATPVMAAAPLVALDFPLKVLVWAADDYQTKLSYTAAGATTRDPTAWTRRWFPAEVSGRRTSAHRAPTSPARRHQPWPSEERNGNTSSTDIHVVCRRNRTAKVNQTTRRSSMRWSVRGIRPRGCGCRIGVRPLRPLGCIQIVDLFAEDAAVTCVPGELLDKVSSVHRMLTLHSRRGLCVPTGVSQVDCTSAALVQPNLRTCVVRTYTAWARDGSRFSSSVTSPAPADLLSSLLSLTAILTRFVSRNPAFP